MIKVGDRLPAGKLQEFIEVEGNGCSIGPNSFDVEQLTERLRRIESLMDCLVAPEPAPRPAARRGPAFASPDPGSFVLRPAP